MMSQAALANLETRYKVQAVESDAMTNAVYLMDSRNRCRNKLVIYPRKNMLRRLFNGDVVLVIKKQELRAFAEELLGICETHFESTE